MPAGKRRLKFLLTTGLQVGGDGTFLKDLRMGSVQVTSPSFSAGKAGSADSVEVTVSGLKTSHKVLAFPMEGISACTALLSACPSAEDTLSLTFGYIAGSGGQKASEHTVTVGYIAFETG